MKLVWNGTARPDDEVSVYAEQWREDLSFGRAALIKHRWTVNGFLKSETFAGLKTLMSEIETMFTIQRGELKFTDNGGSSIPGFTVNDSNSLNGVRITKKRWVPVDPSGKGVWGVGTDLVNVKGYQLEFQCEKIDTGGSNTIDYVEHLIYDGAGVEKRFLVESLTGTPEPQQPVADTISTIIQQGYSVGLTDYVADPVPYYPDQELRHLRRTQISRPRYGFVTPTFFTKRWTYVFQFPGVRPAFSFTDPPF